MFSPSIAELISSSGINIICSSIRRLVRGRGLHHRGGAGDVVQDREAAEGFAEGFDDDDQEGRTTAQDAEEDALQTEVIL